MPNGQNATQPTARRPWFTSPLAWAAAAFAAGIWTAGRIPLSTALWGWLAGLLILCTVIAVALAKTQPAYITALLAVLCSGGFARILAPVVPVTIPPPE